jgi:hypothetical protein
LCVLIFDFLLIIWLSFLELVLLSLSKDYHLSRRRLILFFGFLMSLRSFLFSILLVLNLVVFWIIIFLKFRVMWRLRLLGSLNHFCCLWSFLRICNLLHILYRFLMRFKDLNCFLMSCRNDAVVLDSDRLFIRVEGYCVRFLLSHWLLSQSRRNWNLATWKVSAKFLLDYYDTMSFWVLVAANVNDRVLVIRNLIRISFLILSLVLLENGSSRISLSIFYIRFNLFIGVVQAISLWSLWSNLFRVNSIFCLPDLLSSNALCWSLQDSCWSPISGSGLTSSSFPSLLFPLSQHWHWWSFQRINERVCP